MFSLVGYLRCNVVECYVEIYWSLNFILFLLLEYGMIGIDWEFWSEVLII